MNKLHQVLRATLLLLGSVVLFLVAAFIVQTILLERETAAGVDATLTKLRQTSTEANRVLLETGLTMKNLREASGAWKQSSEAQAAATTSVVEAVHMDLAKLGTLIDHTDATLNSQIGPQTMAVLHAFAGTVESLDADAKALKPGLDSAAEAAKNAAVATSQLPEIVNSVQMTTKNVAGMTADTKQMTGDTAAYVHRLTSPKQTVVGIGKAILEFMYKIKLVML